MPQQSFASRLPLPPDARRLPSVVRRLPLFGLPAGGVAVGDSLQVFAVEDELAFVLKDLVGGTVHAEVRVFRGFFEVGLYGVDRVADEDRFDEAQLVVAVTEGVDAVGRDQTQPEAKNHRPRHEAFAEAAFLAGENLV